MTQREPLTPNAAPAARIELSLISHTNVGKTTLARTLLREDIGEVGDRAHVTEVAESHVLIESTHGDALVLWDTPGFGDSARLLRRLLQSSQPLGWFLSQVWDRFADRPFWCSQQAMRTARASSDVILYVANAGEQPGSAGYVDAELRILGWMGKPVIVLLNQLGPPGERSQAESDLAPWKACAAEYPWIAAVLAFDAFARCWVQEGTLLAQVQALLPEALQQPFARLRARWRQRNLEMFGLSMRALAAQIAAAALDREPVEEPDGAGRARAWLGAVTGRRPADAHLERAEHALAARLDAGIRSATQELVGLHGLTGAATEQVLQRMGREFAVERPADADKASVWGGLVSGALGGLAADLGAGGLTIGAGALIGGVLGALGARSLAKAYNLARGGESGSVRWSDEFLLERVAAALIRYLAVAHFGRGRGEFVSAAAPPHWAATVNGALSRHRAELDELWRLRSALVEETDGARPERFSQRLLPILTASARDVLVDLYPDCAEVFA